MARDNRDPKAQPAPRRRNTHSCVFCGHEDVEQEHVWPNWLAERGPTLALYTSFIEGAPEIRRPYTSGSFTQTARIVCHPCNGGWMGQLEGDVKKELVPMMDGDARALYGPSQALIARWAVKTVLALSCTMTHDATSIPSEDFEGIREGDMPGRLQVWVGYLPVPSDVGHFSFHRFSWFDQANPTVKHEGYTALLGVHELVFLVVVGSGRADLSGTSHLLSPEGPTTARMLQMWPPSESYSINWPPPVNLVQSDLDAIAAWFDGLAQLPPQPER